MYFTLFNSMCVIKQYRPKSKHYMWLTLFTFQGISPRSSKYSNAQRCTFVMKWHRNNMFTAPLKGLSYSIRYFSHDFTSLFAFSKLSQCRSITKYIQIRTFDRLALYYIIKYSSFSCTAQWFELASFMNKSVIVRS